MATTINKNPDLIDFAHAQNYKNQMESLSRNQAQKPLKKKGITDYVKKIPQCVIDLTFCDDNPIGGLPFQSWRDAAKEQAAHNRSTSNQSKIDSQNNVDMEVPLKILVKDWQKQLRKPSNPVSGYNSDNRSTSPKSRHKVALNTSQLPKGMVSPNFDLESRYI